MKKLLLLLALSLFITAMFYIDSDYEWGYLVIAGLVCFVVSGSIPRNY